MVHCTRCCYPDSWCIWLDLPRWSIKVNIFLHFMLPWSEWRVLYFLFDVFKCYFCTVAASIVSPAHLKHWCKQVWRCVEIRTMTTAASIITAFIFCFLSSVDACHQMTAQSQQENPPTSLLPPFMFVQHVPASVLRFKPKALALSSVFADASKNIKWKEVLLDVTQEIGQTAKLAT